MRYYKHLFWIMIFVLLSACGAGETNEQQFIKFKVLDHSQISGFTFQKFFEIRTAQEFEDFWTIHSQPSNKPLPKIDFTQEMVLAVFYGQQQTGGHDIYIHSVEELETELLVRVHPVEPKPGSIRTMMITQPNMIISLPTNPKPVHFIIER
jgi:hypothetical protein